MQCHLYRVTFREPLNPNHRIRLHALLIGGEGLISHVFTLRFAKRDESLYLVARPITEATVLAQSGGQELLRVPVAPGTDQHISFHESGVVNVTAGQSTARLRQAGRPTSGAPLFTAALRDLRAFGLTPFEPGALDGPAGEDVILGSVSATSPCFVSVFRTDADRELPPEPFIVTTPNANEWVVTLRGQNVRYVFSTWTADIELDADVVVFPGSPPGGIPDVRGNRFT